MNDINELTHFSAEVGEAKGVQKFRPRQTRILVWNWSVGIISSAVFYR
jgi:hypothetical protein